MPRLWVPHWGWRQVPGSPGSHLAWQLLCLRCKYNYCYLHVPFFRFHTKECVHVAKDFLSGIMVVLLLCVCVLSVFSQVCCTSLEGQTFFSKKDKPLCKKHAHTLKIWVMTFPHSLEAHTLFLAEKSLHCCLFMRQQISSNSGTSSAVCGRPGSEKHWPVRRRELFHSFRPPCKT